MMRVKEKHNLYKKIMIRIIYIVIGYIAALIGAAIVTSLLEKDLTFVQAFGLRDTYLYAFIGAVFAPIIGMTKDPDLISTDPKIL